MSSANIMRNDAPPLASGRQTKSAVADDSASATSAMKEDDLVGSRADIVAYGVRLGDYFPLPKDPAAREEVSSLGPETLMKILKEFESAEHSRIGDFCQLLWWDKDSSGAYKRQAASNTRFTLPNGVQLTYGQINALAGDFYGGETPISDGKDLAAQIELFQTAWEYLAKDKDTTPKEVPQILAALQQEIKLFNEAISKHQDPAYYYGKLMTDMSVKFQSITFSRTKQPRYAGLAAINFDHFGADAMTAYCAGHTAALRVAARGGNDNLELAYAMNAFADHYLEDQFSSGHMRTPRRKLHRYGTFASYDPDLDYCAKCMHDEDSAIGLMVFNEDPGLSGKSTPWRAYGDKRLMSDVDNTNWIACQKAIQRSAHEIHAAWVHGTVPPVGEYAAWKLRPQIHNDQQHQDLAPLFQADGTRREDVTDRRTWKYISDWTAAGTLLKVLWSGRWNYPITIDPAKT